MMADTYILHVLQIRRHGCADMLLSCSVALREYEQTLSQANSQPVKKPVKKPVNQNASQEASQLGPAIDMISLLGAGATAAMFVLVASALVRTTPADSSASPSSFSCLLLVLLGMGELVRLLAEVSVMRDSLESTRRRGLSTKNQRTDQGDP